MTRGDSRPDDALPPWGVHAERAVRRLGALVALFLVGCASEPASGCGAVCLPTVSFVYEQPVAGTTFQIALSPRGQTLTCGLSATEGAACEPNVGGYHVDMGPEGLRSMSWSFAPQGDLRVNVNVDGRTVTDQTFRYEPASGDACTGTCPTHPRFPLEARSE